MHSRSQYLIILFLFYSSTLIAREVVFLKTLNYNEPTLIDLRSEVKENIQHRNKFHLSTIAWRKYKITTKDNFFFVMSRTLMNHDTLATVNDLVSIYDVEIGKTWWIPNVRGVAREKEVVMKEYPNIWDTKKFVSLPFDSNRVFIPFQALTKKERKYFGLINFIRPVKGIISSAFGLRLDPFSNKKKLHQGIDIACKVGSKVFASETGKVIFSGYKSGYGRTLILEHKNRYQTLYAHLKSSAVNMGGNIERGQLIALSGNTGKSTGPHLHFEVLRGNNPIKPHF